LTRDAGAAPEQTATVLADRTPDAKHHADLEAQRDTARHDGHAAVLTQLGGEVAWVALVEEVHTRTDAAVVADIAHATAPVPVARRDNGRSAALDLGRHDCHVRLLLVGHLDG